MNDDNRKLLDEIRSLRTRRDESAQQARWDAYYRCEPLPRVLLMTYFRARFWQKYLGFDASRPCTPDERIGFFLRIHRIMLSDFADDTVRGDSMVFPPYVDLERKGGTNILGGQREYDPETGSFIDHPILKTKHDLDRLKFPIPRIREITPEEKSQYDDYVHCADGLIAVTAPDPNPPPWDSMFSPFGGACKMVGHLELLMAMHDDPSFVHAVMNWLCDARISYEQERAAMLGYALASVEKEWAQDDVNFPFISRDQYEAFVYPYEIRLASALGNIHYHSCGNLTPYADLIAALPNLVQIDVSACSDLKTFANLVRGRKVRLRKSPHVLDEVLMASETKIGFWVCKTVEDSCGVPLFILCEGFYDGSPTVFDKVRRWTDQAMIQLTAASTSTCIARSREFRDRSSELRPLAV